MAVVGNRHLAQWQNMPLQLAGGQGWFRGEQPSRGCSLTSPGAGAVHTLALGKLFHKIPAPHIGFVGTFFGWIHLSTQQRSEPLSCTQRCAWHRREQV